MREGTAHLRCDGAKRPGARLRGAGRALACALLGLAGLCALDAQTGRGEDLTVKIAVMGTGDQLYFWWGHIGLVIEDAHTGQNRMYDYGVFTINTDDFFLNFALGRLWYSSGASPVMSNLAAYINTNRDVVLYTLDLPPENRENVRRFAEESILPQNRNYLYHHFKDNCATRIRDILDIATEGQFKERFGDAPGRFTLRQHVRRHTWHSPPVDWILNFWMGQDIDTPITVWDEMFLPSEIAIRIGEFEYADPYGISRPLVSGTETVNQSVGRHPVLDVPRRQWPRELAFSLFLAAILGLLLYAQSKSPARGQVAVGICHTLLGIVFGVAGLLLFFMSTFTGHDYTYHNANLLFCNPLLLAAVPLGIRYAASPTYDRRLRAEFTLRVLWLLVALGIFASMLVKLLPQFWQQNLTDQMLMLPIALLLALEPAGLRRMLRRVFWRWL
ncbi:MAG: DUF4105 domain-containing protein [Treponema sp.]|nr:DUF4105 domain-containing protein [Treponema sp.]